MYVPSLEIATEVTPVGVVVGGGARVGELELGGLVGDGHGRRLARAQAGAEHARGPEQEQHERGERRRHEAVDDRERRDEPVEVVDALADRAPRVHVDHRLERVGPPIGNKPRPRFAKQSAKQADERTCCFP